MRHKLAHPDPKYEGSQVTRNAYCMLECDELLLSSVHSGETSRTLWFEKREIKMPGDRDVVSFVSSHASTISVKVPGQPNSNGNRKEFSNPSFRLRSVRFSEFPSSTVVMTSPNVHGDEVSIVTW